MRIQVDDPGHVESVLTFLNSHVHVVAAQVDEDQVDVSQLGSGNLDARRMELDLLLRVWEARTPGASATILS